jgi:hypothetical protein
MRNKESGKSNGDDSLGKQYLGVLYIKKVGYQKRARQQGGPTTQLQ